MPALSMVPLNRSKVAYGKHRPVLMIGMLMLGLYGLAACSDDHASGVGGAAGEGGSEGGGGSGGAAGSGSSTDATDGPSCVVGEICGDDCARPAEAPCHACGTLFRQPDCYCRVAHGSGACYWPDCSDPSPGTEGAYCGEYWWCDRRCAAGLACLPERDDGGRLEWLSTCQPTVDSAAR